jgi:hypothetical protein
MLVVPQMASGLTILASEPWYLMTTTVAENSIGSPEACQRLLEELRLGELLAKHAGANMLSLKSTLLIPPAMPMSDLDRTNFVEVQRTSVNVQDILLSTQGPVLLNHL